MTERNIFKSISKFLQAALANDAYLAEGHF